MLMYINAGPICTILNKTDNKATKKQQKTSGSGVFGRRLCRKKGRRNSARIRSIWIIPSKIWGIFRARPTFSRRHFRIQSDGVFTGAVAGLGKNYLLVTLRKN